LRLATSSGSIDVLAEERADILVEASEPQIGKAEADDEGVIEVEIVGGWAKVSLRVPLGSDLMLGTLSGTVRLAGELGRVTATTHSGDIKVRNCAKGDLRTGSGKVFVAACTGKLRAMTRSGSIHIGETGSAELSTMSSGIEVAAAAGPIHAKTASGTVFVTTRTADADVMVKSISGSVEIHLPNGTRPLAAIRSLSGSKRLECEPGHDCKVAVQTVSGSIRVSAA
jgi:DUF4097 and DUF4098 domain-containing protein YvlB